jgi:hypothetical protein
LHAPIGPDPRAPCIIRPSAAPREVVIGLHGSSARWTTTQPNVRLGTSIEVPYANVGETTVTVESA